MKKQLLPLLLLVFFLAVCRPAWARTVSLPITLDYPLLRALIVNQAFPEAGERSTLVNEGNGCLYLGLSSPALTEAEGLIRLEMKVAARAGTPVGTGCFGQLEWQGYLVFHQRPRLTADTWRLSFTTVATEILGANRQPEKITNLLWSFIEPRIIAHLNRLAIDLMPPVRDLKAFLLPLFPEEVKDKTNRMLASLTPGEPQVLADSIRIDILAEVEEVYDPDLESAQEQLNEEQLGRIVSLWESWDGLLTYLISTLSRGILTEDERLIPMSVLLDTRYRFVFEQTNQTLSRDFVRDQFVTAWTDLSPIFKNHLYRNTKTSELLGYLAFVSASDALLVFDSLGPTFGLEISQNGLIRLMQMLQADPALLFKRPETDENLQKLFRLNLYPENDTPLPLAGPVPSQGKEGSFLSRASFCGTILSLLSPADAEAGQLPGYKEILEWKVPDDNLDGYIRRVEKVLAAAAKHCFKEELVPKKYQSLFTKMLPALAWQESCFRQFVVKDSKLTYLLSYNQSSVGLLQVNERVWKDIFRRNPLRWDIRYNSIAGSEIAAMYLQKYALRDAKTASRLDQASMASLVYAMYNGGPSQYKKYLSRMQTGKFYLSDRLFREKYDWQSAGKKDMLGKCLTGG